MTDEIRNLEPVDADKFIIVSDGKFQRMIFHEPQSLLPVEEEYLEKFETFVYSNNLGPLPEAFKGKSRKTLRYL